MINYHSNPAINSRLEQQYPEIYTEIYPLIIKTAEELALKGVEIGAEALNNAIDSIIKKAGLWDEDEDDAQLAAAQSYGRPHYRCRRRHHNRHTLRDITRILLLRELLSRRHHH